MSQGRKFPFNRVIYVQILRKYRKKLRPFYFDLFLSIVGAKQMVVFLDFFSAILIKISLIKRKATYSAFWNATIYIQTNNNAVLLVHAIQKGSRQ